MLNLYAGTSLSVYIMPINKYIYIYILKSPMSESHEIGKRMGNKTESGTWIFFYLHLSNASRPPPQVDIFCHDITKLHLCASGH